MRLYGVDAPETAQVCKDGAGREYACGDPPLSEPDHSMCLRAAYGLFHSDFQLSTGLARVICAGASLVGGHCSQHCFNNTWQRVSGQLWQSKSSPCNRIIHGAVCHCRRSGKRGPAAAHRTGGAPLRGATPPQRLLHHLVCMTRMRDGMGQKQAPRQETRTHSGLTCTLRPSLLLSYPFAHV